MYGVADGRGILQICLSDIVEEWNEVIEADWGDGNLWFKVNVV